MTPNQPPPESEFIEVPLAWTGVDAFDVLTANQYLVTLDPANDTMYLMVGLVMPPPLMGTTEEIQNQLREQSYLPVRTLGRFALTRQSAGELANVLHESLSRYDQAKGREDA